LGGVTALKNDGSLTVLIVSDRQDTTQWLQSILSREHQVQVMTSGGGALCVAMELLPALILVELPLPDMEGLSLITAIQDMEWGQHCPAILVIGKADVEMEKQALHLGAADYFSQPLHREIAEMHVFNHIRSAQNIRMLESMCKTDPLTGISNRRDFESRLNIEWNRALREHGVLSMLMVDVDYFKRVNDTYGHIRGDILLRNLAQCIRSNLRRGTDFVARIGGEEFAVLLPGTDLKGACTVAGLLRKEIQGQKLQLPEGKEECITVSIGVACMLPTLERTPEALSDSADYALYQAKERGRNQVYAEDRAQICSQE